MLGLGLSITQVALLGGVSVPVRPTKVLFEGDSIVAFTNPDSWARLWQADHAGVTSANYAVGGSQVPDLINRQAAALAYAPSLLIVGIGANDLRDDTAGYLADLYPYTDQFRAMGTKVILATVLPRTSVANWSTKRANYRAAILAAIGTKIDDVIDFNTCPMGVDGAENDNTLYIYNGGDQGLHPTGAGHVILKQTAAPYINHALGLANDPLGMAFAPQAAATADTDYDSATYTVAGLYAGESRPYSVSLGGKVKKNSGSFVTNGSGSVVNGDTLTVRNRSSANPATQTDVVLTVGGATATYSVTTAGAGARDWVPTDLGSKLRLWLRPEDLIGSDGEEILTWSDASGRNVVVTGAGTSGRPTVKAVGHNGFKAALFDGPLQSRFTLPAGYLSGRSGMASFAVMKLVADPPSAHLGPPFASWGTDSSGEFFPFPNEAIYSSYGAASRHGPIAKPAGILAGWRIVGLHAAQNDWRLFIDGAQITAISASAFAVGTNPVIGFDVNGGGALDGMINEVIDVSPTPTQTERELIEGYLAWKYGDEGNLDPSHPYADARPTI